MGLEVILFVISTAVSAIQARAAKKKAAAARDASLGQDVRDTNSAEPIDIHYGETATSGTRVHVSTRSTFSATGGNLPRSSRLSSLTKGKKNEILSSQHVIGAGDLSDIVEMWSDDQAPNSEFIRGSSLAEWKLGGTSSTLASQFGRGGNNTFTELSYATNVWKLNRKEPQFSGAPHPLYFVRGNRLFDPRDADQSQSDRSTWTYSNNLALVLLDYLTHPVYGLNWSWEEDIDHDAFISAANVCGRIIQSDDTSLLDYGNLDDPIDNPYPYMMPNGDTTPTSYRNALAGFNFYGTFGPETGRGSGYNRYNTAGQSSVFNDRSTVMQHEFNGSISTGASHRDNIGTLLALVEGSEFFRSPVGRWKFSVPDSTRTAAEQSVGIVDASELTNSVSIRYADSTNKLNQLDMRFSNTNKDFADDTITFPLNDDQFHLDLLAEDNGILLKDLLDLRGLSDIYHASSIAANKIATSRRESYTFRTRPSGFLYEPGDVIRLQDDLIDLDVFVRIQTTKVMANLDVDFTAILFDPDDYGWRLAEIESITNRSDILGLVTAPDTPVVTVDNIGRRFRVTWTDNGPADPDNPGQFQGNDSTVNGYLVEARKVGDTEFDAIATTPDLIEVAGQDDQQSIVHVPDNTESAYEYRVSATTTDGRTGPESEVGVSMVISDFQVIDGVVATFSKGAIGFSDIEGVITPATSSADFTVRVGSANESYQHNVDPTALTQGQWTVTDLSPATTTDFTATLTDSGNDVATVTISGFINPGDITLTIAYRATGTLSATTFTNSISTVIASQGPDGDDGEQGVDGDGIIMTPTSTGVTLTPFDGGTGAAGTPVAINNGQDGRGITRFTQSGDTVSVVYDDGNTDDFTVTDGDSITVTSVVTQPNGDIRVSFSDGDFADIPPGAAGRGISSITRDPNTMMVTVTFDDSSSPQMFMVMDGDPGTVWHSGSGVPSPFTGVNGDFFLDILSEDVYEKAGGAWAISTNIKGGNGDNVNWVFLDTASNPPPPPAESSTRIPSGWSDSSPSSASNAIWTSQGSQIGGMGNYTWSSPVRLTGTDGVVGTDGDRRGTHRFWSNGPGGGSPPTAITGASYSWASNTGSISPNSAGWVNFTPRLDAPNRALTYWFTDVTFVDFDSNDVNTPQTTASSPREFVNFRGVVTFTDSGGLSDGVNPAVALGALSALDSLDASDISGTLSSAQLGDVAAAVNSGTTTIDGGQIVTNGIALDNIVALTGGNTVGINGNGIVLRDAGGNARIRIGNLTLLN